MKTPDRLEWLDLPAPSSDRLCRDVKLPVIGQRCPRCGWLDPEDRDDCYRCGHSYVRVGQHRALLRDLGVETPPLHIAIDEASPAQLKGEMCNDFEEYRLRLGSVRHDLTPGFEYLLALDEVEIIHFEHQIRAAREALARMRGQVLLADEVGLGKTVEAGLVMKELLLRGLARSVLILAPASVVPQWLEEMRDKFAEEFTVASDPSAWGGDRVLASISTALSDRNARQILARRFDVLIIDEAHKLKNRATKRFRFVNRIRKKYVLLLTATPVHNDLTELYSLLTILKPGILGTVRTFRKHHVSREDPRVPVNSEELRRVLSDVMIRNRRETVGIRLPQRRAAIYHLTPHPGESELYRSVTDYIQEELWAGNAERMRLLTLITLQRELTSSPMAVAGTLRRMAGRPDSTGKPRSRLLELADEADGVVGVPRKVEGVLEILEKFPGKVIIYTDFLATMNYLAEVIGAQGIAVELFHGGLDSRHGRTKALQRFREDKRVLISTQTGGEGLNLQFCHQIINFDLPWNPMKVEQRIGRVHRLGQQHPVNIFNLTLTGTIEARVLDLLAHKIRMFELVIGELDLILGELGEEKSFEKLVMEVWRESRSERDLEDGFEELGDRLLKTRHHIHHVREADRILDDLMETT